jgi:hypothetical protein
MREGALDTDFDPPQGLATEDLVLTPLRVELADLDFDAVRSSEAHLLEILPDWPPGLTSEQNLRSIRQHEQEFEDRTAFAYSVLSADRSRCLGCVYLYPTGKPEYDVVVFLWARASELASGFEERLYGAVREWLEFTWPFEHPLFPGRTHNWNQWNRIRDEWNEDDQE